MIQEEQQIKEQINSSKNILILTKKNFSGDHIGSALAWYYFLKKLNKNVEIAVADFQIPVELNFLPEISLIKNNVDHLKKYTVTLDLAQAELEELSYEVTDKELQIFLTPKRGMFRPEDLKLKDKGFKYNLIVLLGCEDYESIGKIFENHPDFFYQTPVINIDYQSQNERQGQINIIELTKTSVAEISYRLFKLFNHSLIDENIATCLLTGLISATNSFKNSNLTPDCLTTASDLIAQGANKEKIITNLYRNKTINTLNLWGKVLSKLKAEKDQKIIWSQLSKADLNGLTADDNVFINIINELLTSAQNADILVIFVEKAEGLTIYLYNNNLNINLLPITRKLNGQGDKKFVIFHLPETGDTAIENFLNQLKETITSI